MTSAEKEEKFACGDYYLMAQGNSSVVLVVPRDGIARMPGRFFYWTLDGIAGGSLIVLVAAKSKYFLRRWKKFGRDEVKERRGSEVVVLK